MNRFLQSLIHYVSVTLYDVRMSSETYVVLAGLTFASWLYPRLHVVRYHLFTSKNALYCYYYYISISISIPLF